MDLNGWDQEAYCKRIRLLRALMGMNQTDFASFCGIPYKKWHHYERGYPVSRETIFILHKRVDGFSTDWLLFGDMRAIAPGTAAQLKDLEKAERKRLRPVRPQPPMTEVPKRLRRASR